MTRESLIKCLAIVVVIGILAYYLFIPSKTDELLANFSKVSEKEWVGSKSKQVNNNLPLGYSFGMTYSDIYSIRDSLSQNGLADGPFLFKYQMGDSILENVKITFEFDYLYSNSRLEDSKPYSMVIEYSGKDFISHELFEYIRNQINLQYSGYERVDYLISEPKNIKERSEYYPVFKVWTAWFKDNMQIILKDDGLKRIFIEYNNLPIQHPIEQDGLNREIDRAQKRNEFKSTLRQHRKEFEKYR